MPEYETEIKAILSVPSVAAVMPAYEHETEWTKQVRAGVDRGVRPVRVARYVYLCTASQYSNDMKDKSRD